MKIGKHLVRNALLASLAVGGLGLPAKPPGGAQPPAGANPLLQVPAAAAPAAGGYFDLYLINDQFHCTYEDLQVRVNGQAIPLDALSIESESCLVLRHFPNQSPDPNAGRTFIVIVSRGKNFGYFTGPQDAVAPVELRAPSAASASSGPAGNVIVRRAFPFLDLAPDPQLSARRAAMAMPGQGAAAGAASAAAASRAAVPMAPAVATVPHVGPRQQPEVPAAASMSSASGALGLGGSAEQSPVLSAQARAARAVDRMGDDGTRSDEELPGAEDGAGKAAGAAQAAPGGQGKGRRTKLPTHSVEILSAWFIAHAAHPFPSDDQKADLMARAKVSETQYTNWFGNTRARFWFRHPTDSSQNELRLERVSDSEKPIKSKAKAKAAAASASSAGAAAASGQAAAASPQISGQAVKPSNPPRPAAVAPKKFTEEDSKILMAWVRPRIRDPFATGPERDALVDATGLSYDQVTQWFVNFRQRSWKAEAKKQGFRLMRSADVKRYVLVPVNQAAASGSAAAAAAAGDKRSRSQGASSEAEANKKQKKDH